MMDASVHAKAVVKRTAKVQLSPFKPSHHQLAALFLVGKRHTSTGKTKILVFVKNAFFIECQIYSKQWYHIFSIFCYIMLACKKTNNHTLSEGIWLHFCIHMELCDFPINFFFSCHLLFHTLSFVSLTMWIKTKSFFKLVSPPSGRGNTLKQLFPFLETVQLLYWIGWNLFLLKLFSELVIWRFVR